MHSRALWKGVLSIGRQTAPIKMFSAVESRAVHFRMLHRADLEPVVQKIVRKSDGKEVKPSDRRKALPLDEGRAVVLSPDDLDRIEPPASRRIATCEFVPVSSLAPYWYERAYYLSPNGSATDYFALADAIAKLDVAGIMRWTMRDKRYLGALLVDEGYLMVVTLRRADQILSIPETAPPKLDRSQLRLADQLIQLISGDFDPSRWKDDYQDRLRALIESKSRGKILKLKAPKRRSSAGDLSTQLRLSLGKTKGKKVA